MRSKKISLRTWMILKIIPSLVIGEYYWLWTQISDLQSYFLALTLIIIFANGSLGSLSYYKRKRDIIDEYARIVLYKTDSFCLKVSYALLVLISFASISFELSAITMGYLIVISLIIISTTRAVTFCILDSRGM